MQRRGFHRSEFITLRRAAQEESIYGRSYASSNLMGHFAKRRAALEHLIDVVGLVVPHVFHLKMDVVVRKIRVPSGAMPFSGRELLDTPGKLLAACEKSG